MYYADKRQQFLVDQGYYFEVIQQLPFMNDPAEMAKLEFTNPREHVDFLSSLLQMDEVKLEKEEERLDEIEEDEDQRQMMSKFTGGDAGVYEWI